MSARTPADLRALELLEALERDPELAARMRRILFAPLTGVPGPAEFTTRSTGPRPDGHGARTWQRLVPTIPGAVKRGRYWVISTANYERWESSHQSSSPPTSPAPPKPGETDDQQIARLVGGRAVGSVRR